MAVIFRLFILMGIAIFFAKTLNKLFSRPLRAQPVNKSKNLDPYFVLGIPRDATAEEIKLAYKKALSEYHPDKVAHLGKGLQELAAIRTQEIVSAYTALSR
ncbi:MAG: J domain-containing protein [Bdellovibrionaceae bacterium]|nr:J domain-containing protein [Pseudobdellovibrionaceae bacterium]